MLLIYKMHCHGSKLFFTANLLKSANVTGEHRIVFPPPKLILFCLRGEQMTLFVCFLSFFFFFRLEFVSWRTFYISIRPPLYFIGLLFSLFRSMSRFGWELLEFDPNVEQQSQPTKWQRADPSFWSFFSILKGCCGVSTRDNGDKMPT